MARPARLALLGSFLCAASSVRVHGGPNQVALVLMGESFRRNSAGTGTGDREAGSAGYEPQRHAVRSHAEHFILPLLFDLNYSRVDVHIYTQPSPYGQDLVSWYESVGARTVATFGETQLGDVWNSAEAPTLPVSFFDGWEYEGVILARPDMLMKPYFVPAFLAANRSKYLSNFRLERHPNKEGVMADMTVGDTGFIANAGSLAWLPGWSLPLMSFTPKILLTHHDAFTRWLPIIGKENLAYILPSDQARARAHARAACSAILP